MNRIFAAAFLMTSLPLSAVAESHASGDAEAGAKVFRKCQACHAVGEDAKNKVGPILNGIVDRQVATVPDFDYSDALLEMTDNTWTPEELAAFLEKPRDYAPGTKMTFAGLRKEEERANVIAYLATFPGEGG